MAKPLQACLDWVAKTFRKDTSKMLIVTGVLGWALSSMAQMLAILVNPKIKDEQKYFLLPQEFMDAVVNIGSFFLITQMTRTTVSNLFKTGKFAPKNVRKFLNQHKDIYGDKVGKIDFDLETVLKYEDGVLKKNYDDVKDLGTTVATVCAGIIASNIVTPIIRNKMASNVQKSIIGDNKEQPVKTNTQVTVPAPKIMHVSNGSMRI